MSVEYPMTGELLNDEFDLLDHPLAPFKPTTKYRIRMSWRGMEVVGEWISAPRWWRDLWNRE